MRKRLTPLQQLLPLLTACQKSIILPALCELRVSTAEDLCLSLVAFIRFRTRRKYNSPFVDILYQMFTDAIAHPEHIPSMNQPNSSNHSNR